MEKWQTEAFERLPELQDEIDHQYVDGPFSVWPVIWDAFEIAYEPPGNADFIRRVYDFADWCSAQERGDRAANDLLSCAAVCFYEHIPTKASLKNNLYTLAVSKWLVGIMS